MQLVQQKVRQFLVYFLFVSNLSIFKRQDNLSLLFSRFNKYWITLIS